MRTSLLAPFTEQSNSFLNETPSITVQILLTSASETLCLARNSLGASTPAFSLLRKNISKKSKKKSKKTKKNQKKPKN